MSWVAPTNHRTNSSYKNIFETGLDMFPLYPLKKRNSETDKQKASTGKNKKKSDVKDKTPKVQNHMGNNLESNQANKIVTKNISEMTVDINSTADKYTTTSPNETTIKSKLSPNSENRRYLAAVQKYNDFMESMGSTPLQSSDKDVPINEKKTKMIIKKKEDNQYEAILDTGDSDSYINTDSFEDNKVVEDIKPKEETTECSPNKQQQSELNSNDTLVNSTKQTIKKSLDLTEDDTRNINDLLHMLKKVGNKYVLEFYKHLKQFSLGLRPEFFKKYPMVAILLGLNTSDPEQQEFNYSKAKLILAYIHNHPLLKTQLSIYQQSYNNGTIQPSNYSSNTQSSHGITQFNDLTVNQPSTKNYLPSVSEQFKSYHLDNQSTGQSLPTFSASFKELKSPRHLSYEHNERKSVKSYTNGDTSLHQYYNSPQNAASDNGTCAMSDGNKHHDKNILSQKYEADDSGPRYTGHPTSNISKSDSLMYNSGRQYSGEIVHSNNITGHYTSEQMSPKSVFSSHLSPQSISQAEGSPQLLSNKTQGSPHSLSSTQFSPCSLSSSQISPTALISPQSRQVTLPDRKYLFGNTPISQSSPSSITQQNLNQLNEISPNKRKILYSSEDISPSKRQTLDSTAATKISPQKSPQAGFLQSFQSFLNARSKSGEVRDQSASQIPVHQTVQRDRSQNKLAIHLNNAVQVEMPNLSGYQQGTDQKQACARQHQQLINTTQYPDIRKNNPDNTLMNFSKAFSSTAGVTSSISQAQYTKDTKSYVSSAQQQSVDKSQFNMPTTAIKTEPQSHEYVKVEKKHFPGYITETNGYNSAKPSIPSQITATQQIWNTSVEQKASPAKSKKSPKKAKSYPNVPPIHGMPDQSKIKVQTTPLVDRLACNSNEQVPTCNCLNTAFDELLEGPYYTHLGAGANLTEIRSVFENRLGITGSALRIEKILYTGKEGKNPQGCPIAKWVIRRSGPEEKVLIIARPRKGHTCSTAVIVAGICVWDGVVQQQADMLYDYMRDVLPNYGNETERRCGTNEKRTCACQGWDGKSCGASFSFGCSWSMYYNGCKFARSHTPRKFRLQKQSEEATIDHHLQTLVTQLSPLYKQAAPESYKNMVHFEDVARDCRIGYQKGSPFSGVTAVVDFSTHSHKDTNNMNNGCTMVVTLTKHRGFSKPDDEQLHVLPLCIMDTTDENNSPEGQYEKIRNGSIEYLTKYSMKMRVRSFPLLPCKQRKKLGKNVVGYNSGKRGRKSTISSKVKAAKKVVKNCLSNIRGQVRDKVFVDQKFGSTFSACNNKPSGLGIYSNEYSSKGVVKKTSKFGQIFKPKYFSHTFHKYRQDNINPYSKWKYSQYNFQPQQVPLEQMYSGTQNYLAQHQWNSSQFNFYHNHMQWQQWMRMKQIEDYHRQRIYSPGYQNPSAYGSMKYGQDAYVNQVGQYPNAPVNQAHGQEVRSHSLSGQMYENTQQTTGVSQQPSSYQPPQSQDLKVYGTSNQRYSYPVQSAIKSEQVSHCIKQENITTAFSTGSVPSIAVNNSGSSDNNIKSTADYKVGINFQNNTFSTIVEHSQTNQSTVEDLKQLSFSPIKQEIDHNAAVQPECQEIPSAKTATVGTDDIKAGTIMDDPMDGAKEVYTDCEQSFQDSDIGGVAIALTHGSVLFECARKELHATTAMKNPNRYHPTRISLVFYQHKSLNLPNHGYEQYLEKAEIWRQRREIKKLEKEAAEASNLNPEGVPTPQQGISGSDGQQFLKQVPTQATEEQMCLSAINSQALSSDHQLALGISKPQTISNDYQLPIKSSKPQAISNDYQLPVKTSKPQVISNDYHLPIKSSKPQANSNDYQLPVKTSKPQVISNDYPLPVGTSKHHVMSGNYQLPTSDPQALSTNFQLPMETSKPQAISNDYHLPVGTSNQHAVSTDYRLPVETSKPHFNSNDYQLPVGISKPHDISSEYHLPVVKSKPQAISNEYQINVETSKHQAISNDYTVGIPKPQNISNDYLLPVGTTKPHDFLLPVGTTKPQVISNNYHSSVGTSKPQAISYQLPMGTAKPQAISNQLPMGTSNPQSLSTDYHLPVGTSQHQTISKDFQLPQISSIKQALSSNHQKSEVASTLKSTSNSFSLTQVTSTPQVLSNDYRLPKESSKQTVNLNDYLLPSSKSQAFCNDYSLPQASSSHKTISNDYHLPQESLKQHVISNRYPLSYVTSTQKLSNDYQLPQKHGNSNPLSQSSVVNDKSGLVSNFMNHSQGQLSTFTGHEKQSIIQNHNFYQ